MVENSLKNFKLKSRSTYQNLAEEEQALDAELSAFETKFDSWEQEESYTAEFV